MLVLQEKIIFKSKAQRIILNLNSWFIRLPRLFKINPFKKPVLESVTLIPVLGPKEAYVRITYTAKNDYKAFINPIGEISGKYNVLVKVDTQTPDNLALVISGLNSKSRITTKLNVKQFQTVFEEMRKQYPITNYKKVQDITTPQVSFNEALNKSQTINAFENINVKTKEDIQIKQLNDIKLYYDIDTALLTEQFKYINLTTKL